MAGDIRFGLRMLGRSPGFTATALLALALGMGGVTAIYSVMNALLIRPLPYADSERLVVLWGNVQRTVLERRSASYPDFTDWRDRSRSFESMAAVWRDTFTLYGSGEPERIEAEVVSSSYFPMLGIAARLGRTFRPEDDAKLGVAPVAMIGEGLWQRRFGGDPAAVGRVIRLNLTNYTIVGVVPARFRGLSSEVELWVPVMTWISAEQASARGTRWFPALAKLKRGVNVEQAQQEMHVIAGQLEAAYPATNEKRGVEVALLAQDFFRQFRLALFVLLGAAGFVLSIACANVANLLLARAAGRQREMAVRAALGASRARVVRQLLTESVLLAAAGGALGLLIASWIGPALVVFSPFRLPGFVDVSLDRGVLAVCAGVTLLTGILMGLAPVFVGTGRDLVSSLNEAGPRATGGTGRHRFRRALIAAEIACAVVMLTGAGLFLRSFEKLQTLDLGYRAPGLLTASVSFPPAEEAQALAAGRRMLEKLTAIPGVERVALASDIPLSDSSAMFYSAEGQPPVNATNRPRAYVHRVTPGYFAALGMRFIAGRDFHERDLTAAQPAVAIVTEALVRRFWSGQPPLGKRIRAGGANAPWIEIVGVVGDANLRGIPQNPTADPDVFFPFNERERQFGVLIRTNGDPAALTPALRDAARSIDRSATVFNTAAMTERVAIQMARSRFLAWLLSVFAALALILVLIGVYGVVAQAAGERTREIGVRMAMGAQPRWILLMVAAEGAAVAGAGLLAGLAGAWAVTRVVRTLLYEVTPTDPLTFSAVALLMAAAVVAASVIPARRAARMDPVRALRYE